MWTRVRKYIELVTTHNQTVLHLTSSGLFWKATWYTGTFPNLVERQFPILVECQFKLINCAIVLAGMNLFTSV
jgi:hypothetical protein